MDTEKSLEGIRGAWGYDVDSKDFVDELRSPKRKRGERRDIHIQIEEDYINFGDYCRGVLGMQCQYGFHYLEGLGGKPHMGEGLRIIGKNSWDYHTLKIHKDDAEIFRQRIEQWENRFNDNNED